MYNVYGTLLYILLYYMLTTTRVTDHSHNMYNMLVYRGVNNLNFFHTTSMSLSAIICYINYMYIQFYYFNLTVKLIDRSN